MKTQNIMLYIVALVFTTIAPNKVCANESPAGDDLVAAKDMSFEFHKLNTSGKRDYLSKQLKSGSFSDYYLLLSRAEKKDVPCFKKTFLEYDNSKVLLGIGEYIKQRINEIEQEMIDTDSLAKISNDEMLSLGKSIEDKILLLEPEIKILTKKHLKEIVGLIKTKSKGDSVCNDGDYVGAMFSLKRLGEEGFESLLTSVENEEDCKAVKLFANIAGADALIPCIRYYENLANEAYQKMLAIEIIKDLNWNDVAIFDKSVDALLKCRLSNQSGMANLLIRCLGKNKDSINYIVGHSLSRLTVKELDLIIPSLCSINFQAFYKYIGEIDFAEISDESKLEILSGISCKSKESKTNVESSDLQSDYFLQLFMKVPPRDRTKYILEFEKFPAEKMSKFYIENFEHFTESEKRTVIQLCDYSESRKVQFPKKLRVEVYKKIKPMCSDEMRMLINWRLDRDKG